jgi:hypothetical protein
MEARSIRLSAKALRTTTPSTTRLGGYVHSNTAESHFALLKRGIMGNFHNISEAHLHRYLAEFDFRANTRKLTDSERCDALLAGAKGKRLLYRNPDNAAHP